MGLRFSGALLLAGLVLAGCEDSGRQGGKSEAAGDDGQVECAIGKEGGWTRDCLVDRTGDLLVVRHPDGGFRRLRIVSNGQGLVVADGAEAAKLTIIGDRRIEVAIGPDRYRLPATVATKPD